MKILIRGRTSCWRPALALAVLVSLISAAVAERPFFRPRHVRKRPATLVTEETTSPRPLSLPSPGLLQSPELPTVIIEEPAPVLAEPTPAPVLDPAPVPATPRGTTVLRPSGSANVMLRVTDAFANRFIARSRQTGGAVNDCVLGARVTGAQSTESNSAIRFVPSESTARFDILLRGVTNSTTTSTTPQASIDATGRQTFDVYKPVEFDGRQFVTRSPGAMLDSCQQNRQARSRATNIPVIGSFADTVALMTAERYRPMAQMEGARRVTNRVAPEFNATVDERLAALNQALERTRQRAPNVGQIFSGSLQCHSTEHELSAECQIGAASPLSPAPPVSAQAGASLRLHESAVTSWIDAAQIGSREVAVADLDQWLQEFRDRLDLVATVVEPQSEAPRFDVASGATLVLADASAVSVRFDQQQFQIVLRVSVRPAVGPTLDQQQIVIAYECRQEPESVRLIPRPTTVTSSDGRESSAIDQALQNVVRDQVQSRLAELTIPASLIVPASQTGAKLTLQSLTLGEGWLAIDWQ